LGKGNPHLGTRHDIMVYLDNIDGYEEVYEEFDGLSGTTEFIYYDIDFTTKKEEEVPKSTSLLCLSIYSSWLWWFLLCLQIFLLPLLLILHRLLCKAFIHISNVITLYLQLSLYTWLIVFIFLLAACSQHNLWDKPLIICLLVLILTLLVLSALDCCLAREGWFLLDLKDFEDGVEYFEKLKQNGPVVKVHIECYHSSTSTSIGSGGSNLLTKNEKIITYTDQQEVPLTGWSDVTEWPTLTDLASQGYYIIGVDIDCAIDHKDEKTKKAIDSFRNKFVEQNCHKDDEIKTWVSCELPHFGQEQSIFVSARQKSETSIAFNIGIYLLTSFFCMSCPVRTIIRRKTKLLKLKIHKSYWYEPGKTSPLPPLPVLEIDFELKDNSENKKKVDNADGNNHSPNMRKDLNEFTTSPGSEKRSSVYVEEKKLLNEAIEEESKIKNGKSELSKFSKSVTNTLENEDQFEEKMVLLSEGYGERTIMLSPLVQTSTDMRYLIIPVEGSEVTGNETGGSSTAVALPDTQTAMLAKQIRDRIAKQKLLETAKILCNVLEEPVRTCMRDNMIQNNLVGIPRIQYSNDYQESSFQSRNSCRDYHPERSQINTQGETVTRLYLPGRDYYDESLTKHQSVLNNLEHGVQLRPNDTDNENQHGNQDIYLQHPEKNNFARTKNRYYSDSQETNINSMLQYSTLSCPAQRTNDDTIDDEGLLMESSNVSNPRIDLLKNTNVQADKQGRCASPRLTFSPTPNKRVHYCEEDVEYKHGRRSYDPPKYIEDKSRSPRFSRRYEDDSKRKVHYADSSYNDDSSNYGYYRRYQSPSPVPVHYNSHRSRAMDRYRHGSKNRGWQKFTEDDEEFNA